MLAGHVCHASRGVRLLEGDRAVTDNTDRIDPDLTKALARGREPRRVWALLLTIEDAPQVPSRAVDPLALWVVALLLLAGAALAKC